MTTILLVDDNDDLREAIAEVLRQDGYDVVEAEHGKAAYDLLQEMPAPPCLVLLDLMMPIMNGPELLEALHESKRLEALRVVVLSAGGKAADVPMATKFMGKPFDPEALLAVVREYCGDCTCEPVRTGGPERKN